MTWELEALAVWLALESVVDPDDWVTEAVFVATGAAAVAVPVFSIRALGDGDQLSRLHSPARLPIGTKGGSKPSPGAHHPANDQGTKRSKVQIENERITVRQMANNGRLKQRESHAFAFSYPVRSIL